MSPFSDLRQHFKGASTPQEKRLVLKLDFFILTFCCLAYFMNYLDRASITQAYVSGMRQDLGFKGAQLTEVTTLYATAYLIGIVPNNLLLPYFKPKRFFPFMITTWAIITMLNAVAKTPQHMMVIRFFQGYFESCIFAGTQYILGSWYTKKELGQRTGLFTASGLAGGMFGGFLQTAIYSSMNGLHGMQGWKWLFIISGIITLPVAIYGYFFFPDTPSTTTAFYPSEEEIKLAQERVPIREEGEKILTWSFISRILHSWYFYGFCFLWILGNTSESQSNQSLLNLYMQSHPTEHYTVFQRNNYPTGVQAVGVVSTLLWATSTDIWGRRWLSGYYVAFTAIANAAIILAPTSTAAKFGAYYWAGSIYCIQATFFAWANDSMRNESPALRACVIACMNAAGNCFQAWWPLIFFRADDAPEFRKGMIAMIAVGTAMMIWVTVLIFMDRRLSKKQIQVIEAVDADSHAEAGLSAVKNVDSRDKGSTDK
ncbi:Pantothenate transporter liz1 [Colletotrichum aenigma]|uniref:Pantothenate transporter liz1 n=1 Tax=Colletotrichum aenigma TaxID=1215731 RepID=UPI0018726440|nr:Pantothenate transporter liz1 [Colletotrichum aenigma]KAF5519185.1 Pantothenate transporter liz1 [Colletotrichum aenigma]